MAEERRWHMACEADERRTEGDMRCYSGGDREANIRERNGGTTLATLLTACQNVIMLHEKRVLNHRVERLSLRRHVHDRYHTRQQHTTMCSYVVSARSTNARRVVTMKKRLRSITSRVNGPLREVKMSEMSVNSAFGCATMVGESTKAVGRIARVYAPGEAT